MAAPALARVGELLRAKDMGLIRSFRWYTDGDEVVAEIVPVPALERVEIAVGSRPYDLSFSDKQPQGSQQE